MRGGIYFFPRNISIDAYIMLFRNPNIIKGAGISILRVVVGTGTGLFVTGLLAYIVSVRGFSGRRFMKVIFLVTIYFSGGLIPFYLLLSKLGLTNTFNVYWIPGLINAYYMLLIASYIQNLPDSMQEAPRIDGCSEFSIYCQIIIPISLPVFAAIGRISGGTALEFMVRCHDLQSEWEMGYHTGLPAQIASGNGHDTGDSERTASAIKV